MLSLLDPCFKVLLGAKSGKRSPVEEHCRGALSFGFSLHDGARKATALFQEGESCLGEGRRRLLSPGGCPSGWHTCNTVQ